MRSEPGRTPSHATGTLAFLNALWETFRQALRSLRRTPGLSLSIIAVFALGIGANATMLETLDRLLFSAPPHIQEPDAVKRIYVTGTYPSSLAPYTVEPVSYPDFQDFREMASFEAVATYLTRGLTLGSGASAEPAEALLATHDYWQVIRAAPALGRFFDEEDDTPESPPVAVIGYGLWARDYARSPDVIGQTLDFGYGPYTIVGVAPRGFTTLDLAPVDLVLPYEPAARHLMGAATLTARPSAFTRVVARLAAGVDPTAGEAEATARHRAGRTEEIEAGWYDPETSVLLGSVIGARGPLMRDEVRVSTWLGGVALIVLLIACLNVANLLLARALRSGRESGVRLALGVSRGRLIGQSMVEGALLGLGGVAAAILVDRWTGAALRRTLLPSVAWDDMGLPLGLWGILALAALGAGVLVALPSALRVSGTSIVRALQGQGTGTSRLRMRSVLPVVQASLSVVLLVGAGLFIRSLDEVRALDPGFRVEGLFDATLVTVGGALTPAESGQLVQAAADRVRGLPGVEGASAAAGAPFRSSFGGSLVVPGVDSLPSVSTGGPYVNAVGEDYFRTLGLRVTRGRALEPEDHRSGGRSIVLGDALARAAWPGADPVGRCVQVFDADSPCFTVVGVAADPRRLTLVDEAETFQYWIPVESTEGDFMRARRLAVRLADPAALSLVRAELLQLDPRIRFVQITPFEEVLAPQLRAWQLGATLFSAFGILALVVAGFGLYSVIAFDVVLRRREIGIRTALGATARRVVKLVVLQGLRLAGLGVAIGLAAAAFLAPQIEDLLYGVGAHDGATFATVAVVLLLVAVVAAGFPARRAAKVDPMTALRAE